MQPITDRIERARELLATVHHAAMATVNEDGSPHNTPYFFMRSADVTKLYWSSNPTSLHSVNVSRVGQIFVVLYGQDKGGGLYIQANEAHATEGEELEAALEVHNAERAKAGKEPLGISYYAEFENQRMYQASVQRLWINAAERDADGKIIRDVRHQITPQDLI